MFNMYQELADRINELLKENKKLKNKIERLEKIYSNIPARTITKMFDEGKITNDEQLYWAYLKYVKRKDDDNE